MRCCGNILFRPGMFRRIVSVACNGDGKPNPEYRRPPAEGKRVGDAEQMSGSFGLDSGYTAFEHWDYQPIIWPLDQNQFWRDMAGSYFRACLPLAEALAAGKLNEDVEGTAVIFLFRHYLELMLKGIILAGRRLISQNEVATRDIPKVAHIHDLAQLWEWVLTDAKPKLDNWDTYDIASLEKCISEFDRADKKGFAFRYDGFGGKRLRFDFVALYKQMDHLRQILEGISGTLDISREHMEEYENNLESEYRSDMYG